MIEKMTSPTTMLSAPAGPAGDELAEGPHHPAGRQQAVVPARVRINRVVATFSTSRNSVVANNNEGKMLNSSGVRT